MYKINYKRFAVVGSLVCVVGLTGCFGGGSDLSDDQIESRIKQAFENQQSLDSGAFVMNFDGFMDSEEYTDESGQVNEAQNIEFDVTLDGKVSKLEDDSTKKDVELNLNGSMSYNGQEYPEFSLSLVQMANTMYFKIGTFPQLTDPNLAVVNTAVDFLKGKWWSLPVPDDALEGNPASALIIPLDEDELTEEELAVRDLYRSTDFFEVVEADGSEDVEGVKSDKYEVELDENAVFDFAVQSAEIRQEPMSIEEQDSLRAALDGLDLEFTVWISQDGDYLTKVDASLEVESREEDRPGSASINVDMLFTDHNEAMEIVAPEGASELPLDPSQFFGAPAGVGEGF